MHKRLFVVVMQEVPISILLVQLQINQKDVLENENKYIKSIFITVMSRGTSINMTGATLD